MSSPRYRKALSEKQIYLLKLLYKFRFGTSVLLAGNNSQSAVIGMNQRLKILFDQECIGRNYDSSHHLPNRPANYYLKPNAIRLLKSHPGLAHSVLQNAYKDKSAGQAFINHCLSMFAIYRHLQTLLGDTLQFYSKSELAAYDHFPERLPDAYIKIDDKEYFLELIEADIPNFTVRRKLQSYTEHYDEDAWPEEAYPALLLICETARQERQLQRLTNKQLAASDAEDIETFTTTLKALLGAPEAKTTIWSDVSDPEEPVSIW